MLLSLAQTLMILSVHRCTHSSSFGRLDITLERRRLSQNLCFLGRRVQAIRHCLRQVGHGPVCIHPDSVLTMLTIKAV